MAHRVLRVLARAQPHRRRVDRLSLGSPIESTVLAKAAKRVQVTLVLRALLQPLLLALAKGGEVVLARLVAIRHIGAAIAHSVRLRTDLVRAKSAVDRIGKGCDTRVRSQLPPDTVAQRRHVQLRHVASKEEQRSAAPIRFGNRCCRPGVWREPRSACEDMRRDNIIDAPR